jgi:hypothetical protein
VTDRVLLVTRDLDIDIPVLVDPNFKKLVFFLVDSPGIGEVLPSLLRLQRSNPISA